jgi:hypothetical protein
VTPNQVKEATTVELLVALRNKMSYVPGQESAGPIWTELRKRLTDKELTPIEIGCGHHMMGMYPEGPNELQNEINKLIKKLEAKKCH